MSTQQAQHEMMFIGQLMVEPRIFYDTEAIEEWFESTLARVAFLAIRSCHSRGVVPDQIAVCDYSKEIDPVYISNAYSMVSSTANWTYYEGRLRDAYRRRLISMLGRRMLAAVDTTTAVDEVVDIIEGELQTISGFTARRKVQHMSDLITEYMSGLDERVKNGGMLPGYSTGLPGLDRVTLGFRDSCLYYVGARPSHGKSALLVNMACNTAIRLGIPTGIISLESSKQEIMGRIFSSEGEMDGWKLATGRMSQNDYRKIDDFSTALREHNLYVYDEPNTTISDVKSQIRRMVRQFKVKIVFIDYLQIIENRAFEQKREQVADSSKALKQLCRNLNIPIVCAAQLKRDADGRRPTLSDFEETGQIEKDADCAMLIHHTINDGQWDSQIVVAKNRDGAIGDVPVLFKKEYVKFTPGVDNID